MFLHPSSPSPLAGGGGGVCFYQPTATHLNVSDVSLGPKKILRKSTNIKLGSDQQSRDEPYWGDHNQEKSGLLKGMVAVGGAAIHLCECSIREKKDKEVFVYCLMTRHINRADCPMKRPAL